MSPQTFKHFKILELLGKGGMGEVYLALDTTLERKVALKFLPRDLLRDPSAQGRLLDEARSVSRVQHPNIAVIHSIEEDGGIFALCMEYVDGATLKQLMKRGPLALNQIVRIGADIASAMAVAHEQGIVHRDLKPANVMISRRGEVKVMDFGLALRPERVVNTLGPNTYGTVQYMSPEQAQGKQLTAASDIFSMGSLFYELIAGRPPFAAANDLAILQAIINTQPDALRDLRRDVTPALEQVVRGCMAKQADQRWGSMQAIRDELQYVEPTIAAGPSDLISELSSGLADQGQPDHHRPDNAGRVGRRIPGSNQGSPSGPVDPDLLGMDLPEGIVVHEIHDDRTQSPAATPSVRYDRTAEFASSPSRVHTPSLVLGPEIDLDSTPSRQLEVQSTSEQWQDVARGNAQSLQGSTAQRNDAIAREAARRAQASKSVTPIKASRPIRPDIDLQDAADGPMRRRPWKKQKTSMMSLILPAALALILVAAVAYAILYRVGVAPAPSDISPPIIERVLGNAETDSTGN